MAPVESSESSESSDRSAIDHGASIGATTDEAEPVEAAGDESDPGEPESGGDDRNGDLAADESDDGEPAPGGDDRNDDLADDESDDDLAVPVDAAEHVSSVDASDAIDLLIVDAADEDRSPRRRCRLRLRR